MSVMSGEKSLEQRKCTVAVPAPPGAADGSKQVTELLLLFRGAQTDEEELTHTSD